MKKLIIILGAVLFMAAAAQAQEPQNGYFLRNDLYRFRLNPGFRPEKNFVSIPAIGNISTNFSTNAGFRNYVFRKDGKLVSFMHPSVSDEEFAEILPSVNKAGVRIDHTIMAAGFRRGFIYHTIDVSLKSSSNLYVPKELFEFMKYGNTYQDTYVIPKTKADFSSYLEFAYGMNMKVAGMVSCGARIKILAGLAIARADIDRIRIDMSGDSWKAKAEGEISGNIPGAVIPTENGTDFYDFGEMDFENKYSPKLAGLGAAIDLGATFTPLSYLKLSASVTDLGGISWNGNIHGIMDSEETVIEYSDKMGDNLEELYKFHKAEDISTFSMLPVTLRVGVEYTMATNFTFGLLGAYHTGRLNWFETRGSLNAKLGILDAALCAGVSEFGINYGGMAALDFGPVNFFISAETAATRLAGNYCIPLEKCNLSVACGLNITW